MPLGKVALKVLCKTLTYGSTTEIEYVADGTFDAAPLSSQDNWHVHGEGGFKPVDGAILVPGNEEMLTEDAAGSTLVSGAWQRIEVNQLEAEPLVLSGWAKVIIDASKDDDVELLDTFEKSADFSLHGMLNFPIARRSTAYRQISRKVASGREVLPLLTKRSESLR